MRYCSDSIVIFFYILQLVILSVFFFFFQAEDGIRDATVTGVQTCALPISAVPRACDAARQTARQPLEEARQHPAVTGPPNELDTLLSSPPRRRGSRGTAAEIGRASCRERVEMSVVAGTEKKKSKKKRNQTK